MIKKLKRKLYEDYLPTRLKDSLLKDLELAEEEIRKLSAELEEERAYASGLQTALRYQQRTSIYINGMKQKPEPGSDFETVNSDKNRNQVPDLTTEGKKEG